ncbi:T9SS type A sorting domain-containing protein [Rubricoccus marinus]|uniref:Secretion system C-terminal sorting domain-containing protein n=1 Tax=Rubricoccus marinus TaxID=716817 RepID=A0A259TUS4_9BACT|nr:T9SS type A sorting domain-containing protein [Rubricoccus marinus]OZC01324.1 hypothetical protein BSZ36_17940 [Rubricoccus marinus]
MRNLYSYAFGTIVMMALGLTQTANAQFTTCPASPAECVVEWDGDGDFLPDINALRNTVANDTDRPEDRVYVLRRGGLYYNEDRIVNDGFDLRLDGQTADQARPEDNVCGASGTEDCGPATLQRFVRDDGTVDAVMIESSNGGGHEFSNLWIMGQDNTGITANYEPIVVNSSGAMLSYDGVIFDRNDWHHLGVKGADNIVLMQNSSFRNLTENTQRYGGRGIRFEAGADSVVFENNTFFNITSFPFQSEAAPIRSFTFNHNTLVNFGLAFNAGGIWIRSFVSNNIMVNPFWQGESADLYNEPNRADPFSGVFGVAALPPRFGFEENRRIALVNNAHWRSPELENYYTTFDPVVRAQPLVNDSTQSFFNLYPGMVRQGNINVSPNLAVAPLTNEVYTTMQSFIESVTNAGPTPFAILDWDPGRLDNPLAINWPLPEDFSYTTPALLTAGTDGLPLGDLNWFPAAKATYLANRTQYLTDIVDLTGPPPENEIDGLIVQAEAGTIGDNAAVNSVEGFTSIFVTSGGFIEHTFTVPTDGTYGLNINTDLRGSDPRGERFLLDGLNLENDDNAGELFFCTSAWTGGTCDHPIATADGFTVYELRNDHLINDAVDGLVLTAGTHTLRIEPVWGYQAFAEIEVVDAGGTVVDTMTPPEAITEGVEEVCEDDTQYCPQGFKSVNLDMDGSVTLAYPIIEGGQSVTVVFFYESESGASGELLIDGASAANLTFTPSPEGSRGTVTASRINITPGTHTFTLSTTTGDIDLDYVQFAVFANPNSTGLEPLPEGWSLGNSFPNPASGAASIQFQLGESADVQLAVFDVLGRKVATLVDGPMSAGPHQLRVNTAELASGTYVYRLTTPVGVQTRRMTVVR